MAGTIVLTGRSKDTIVLSSGKNVEPQPIEDAVQGSAYIKHAVAMGNDKRELGALVSRGEPHPLLRAICLTCKSVTYLLQMASVAIYCSRPPGWIFSRKWRPLQL